MSSLPTVGDAVPEIVIRSRRAQPFFGRHPWIFAGAIDQVRVAPGVELKAGTEVRVLSSEGKFIAWGLFNPVSRIRVRLYSWRETQRLTPEFWKQQVERAVEGRRRQFDLKNESTGCRLIFSEADSLSGLTVDFYGGYVLVQFQSLALFEYRETLIQALEACLKPKGVWLRTEKGMREAEGLEIEDGLLKGEAPPQPLFLEENGVQFGVDVQRGQKTGYFLDQRQNRLAVCRYTQGARVLDAFCFSGGFGITALKCGGAASVVGIDSSESALKLAAANAELNGVANRCQWKKSEVRPALSELSGQGAKFDVVILDPPRMARTRGGMDRAIQGYTRLNLDALPLIPPGGILVTCSCSGLVTRAEFVEMVGDVARQSGRDIQILETHGQPCDHPVSATCPETEYLKVFICRVQ
ncbi:MAG: class I SAM-dependent rRNA methyltransferase [Planctomyces sp.]|nr:class I SAM-dependent rRNA methyltransferase [Planctomyces sp.]